MKLLPKWGLWMALACTGIGGTAVAQTGGYGSPSLLPFPDSTPLAQAAPYYGNSLSAGPQASAGYGSSLTSYSAPAANPLGSPSDPEPLLTPNPNGGGLYGSSNSDTSLLPSSMAPSSDGGNCSLGNNCPCCAPCCCGGRWFGSIGGLAMTRNNGNDFWTTYQTNANANQLMQTNQASGNWGSGGQVTFGRWWCCCNQGIGVQFVYWQLWGMGGYSNITSATNNLSTPIDLGGVNITSGAGTFPAGQFFDNSPEHRIWRTDNVSNFEINFLHSQIYTSPNRCNLICLAGFRYFRFQEALTFGSVAFGHQFGDNGGADEAYLRTQVTNNLYGAQIGVLGTLQITPACGVFIQPKVGIFGNNMIARNQLYTGDGFTTFDIHAHKTAFSMLGEVDLGSYYWLSPNCQLFAGWRVLAVSQVALGDNQFLPYLADSAGFGLVKANGDLIMTGGFAGVAFTF